MDQDTYNSIDMNIWNRKILLLNQEINRFELIATLAMYIGCAIISLGIINRGLFLIKNLKETIQKKQQLLIESIIMDKAF